MSHVVWAAMAIAVAGCGSRDRQTPAPMTVELHLDLWTLCGAGDAEAVIARGPDGFVRGDCARRGDLRLTARIVDGVVVAELTRGETDTVVARETGVAEIAVQAAAELPEAVTRPGLRIEVAGAPTVEVAAERIDALVPGRRPRGEAPLSAILVEAGLDVSGIGAMTARSQDGTRLELPVTPEGVALRYNRRGTLRLAHTVAGVEREHLKDVIAIEIIIER